MANASKPTVEELTVYIQLAIGATLLLLFIYSSLTSNHGISIEELISLLTGLGLFSGGVRAKGKTS